MICKPSFELSKINMPRIKMKTIGRFLCRDRLFFSPVTIMVLRLSDDYLPVLGNSANISVNSLSSSRADGQNGLANNAIRYGAGK